MGYDRVVRSSNDDSRLADLADAVVGVMRQLRLPTDPAFVECTPVEISVMRFINRHPGASAREASDATLLPTSNFSRVLRGLERKGLVARTADDRDGRIARLFPTQRAVESTDALRETWSETLDGLVEDPEHLELVVRTLRHIEDELIDRRKNSPDRDGRAYRRNLTPNSGGAPR